MTLKHRTMGLIIVWLGSWVWFMRYHLIDDTLIHLRVAELFWQRGYMTYSGYQEQYGDSSILWILFLSVFDRLFHSVMVPKFFSLIFYLTFLITQFFLILKSRGLLKALWIVLGLISISPMGLRWLTDGMETSLWVFMSFLMAIIVHHVMHRPTRSPVRYLSLAALCFFLVCFRFEFTFIIFFSTMAIFLDRLHIRNIRNTLSPDQQRSRWLDLCVWESHFALGGLLALAVIFMRMGSFYPDTAIAKALVRELWWHSPVGIFSPIISSFSLGIGLVLLWLTSFAIFIRLHNPGPSVRKIMPTIIINALVLFVMVLICIRGQWLQGVRPILWTFVFPIVWNVRSIGELKHEKWKWSIPKFMRVVLVFVLLSLWFWEGLQVARIVEGRSKVLSDMSSHHLERLAAKPFVGYDIGFMMYFSKGMLCDMNGLPHGPEFAALSMDKRAEYCAATNPVFLFVDQVQARFLSNYIDFDSWIVCHEYEFTNVMHYSKHYLLVRPDEAEGLCMSARQTYRQSADAV